MAVRVDLLSRIVFGRQIRSPKETVEEKEDFEKDSEDDDTVMIDEKTEK